MNVRHHLPDESLFRYAAGDTDEGASVLFACHLSLCATCRERLSALEMLGGALLRPNAPAMLQTPDASVEALLGATLSRLDEVRDTLPAEAPAPACDVLPAPLTRLVGPLAELKWRRPVPGLEVVELPVHHAGIPLRLKRMRAGMQIPMHSHRGEEFELVLDGGATDMQDGSRYERGDVAFNDPSRTHALQIDEDGACIALGMHDARLLPSGMWSHLVFGWLGW